MSEKLMPFLEAIKSGKTVHYWDRQDYSHPYTGPDIRDTDIYMKYLPETAAVEVKTNTAVYPDNEYDSIIKMMPLSEFEKWFMQLEERAFALKIIED